MSELSLDQDEAKQQAEDNDLIPIQKGKDWLMLDIDHALDAKKFIWNYDDLDSDLLKHFDGPREAGKYECWNSKSGTGVHVCIQLTEEISEPFLFIIQSHLGSDTKRDYLSLCRLLHGTEDSRLLFRPKKAKVFKSHGEMLNLVRFLAGEPVEDYSNAEVFTDILTDDDLPF